MAVFDGNCRGIKVLITGATDGLGRATAMELAERGAVVLTHGRDMAKGEALVESLRAAGAQAAFFYQSDFSKLADVNRMLDEIVAAHESLDVLVNNAGILPRGERIESEDGNELTFQVNYLAGYLMTTRLLPLLEAANGARIVMVSSAGQEAIDFDDVMLMKWNASHAYRQSKLAQVMMAKELAPQLMKKNITINAIHPASHMPTKMVTGLFTVKSPLSDGVGYLIRLICSPEWNGVTGEYGSSETLKDALAKAGIPEGAELPLGFSGASYERAHEQAFDAAARRRLLALSERLCSRALGAASSAPAPAGG